MEEKPLKLKGKIRKFLYENIITLRATPHSIALGLAIGVFVGFLPIMGFQTVVAIPIAIMLRASKVTSALGVWISNPVTFIPFYYFNFVVGRWMLGNPKVEWAITKHTTFTEIMSLGWNVLYPLWLGCVVLGLICIPFVYFFSYRFIIFYRNFHKKNNKND